ncbi:MAG TPA: helix-turn-helix domain-containing protein, partial [Chloroflexia bacterium]|nr:helix-turn-helix domain-containing protein [Chloroflexia bacterium]
MSDAITFGAWLKQRRKEQGVPADYLAERIGCSTVTLLKIESGDRRPSRQIALLLADSFDIPDDEREAFVTFARTGVGVTSEGPSAAPWRIAHLRHVNLPAVLTSLVGREVEERATREQLLNPRTRLLTLTGPPGIGKTRLALEVASQTGENFQDGVYFVDLSPVIDPDLVLEAVGRVLGLKEGSDRPMEQAILDHVRDRRMLLVLDNFEQVLDAAPVVVRLLEGCPWLKVLATSREALHVRGEKHLPVRPLALPDLNDLPPAHALDKYPAVKLFAERAAEAEHDFALTTENARDVATICVSLEGLPLAIELAAARARQLPPAEMRAALSGRLKLLTAGARDLPARQRTLRGAVEWSYNLLEEPEQRCFRRLGVFVGGYTVEAAKAVVGADDSPAADTVKNLEMLLNKNLITRHQGELRRLGMLETLREYALEQLAARGEEEETRDRHARYFLALAQGGGEHFAGADVVTWVQQVAAEYNNIRAALAWFLGAQERHEVKEWAMLQRGDPNIGESEGGEAGSEAEFERIKLGTDLCTALFPFWDAQHHLGEARAWYALAAEKIASFAEAPDNRVSLDSGPGTTEITVARKITTELAAIWARMLAGAGAMAYYQGEYDAT